MQETTEKELDSAQNDSSGVLLGSVWIALKKRLWMALVTAVVVAAGYYMYATVTYQPIYRTSATFTVSIKNNYGSSTDYYNNATAKQMAVTFPYILESGILGNLVADDMGYDFLPGTVSAKGLEETNLFTLTVTATDPQLAYDLLQSVIRNYPQVAEFVVGSTKLTLMDEDGVVTKPINGVSWKTALQWGGIAGVVVLALAAALYMALHQTIRNVDDIKKMTSAKCMATVPLVTYKKRTKVRSKVLITQQKISRAFVEAIYRVRVNVEKGNQQVLLVTSALPGEGKTTIAVNLALSLAKSGKRVVLIDGDLRHPSVGKYLGIPAEVLKTGLAEFLCGKVALEKIGFTVSNLNNLIVIPGGSVSANAAELLEKPLMADMIRTIRPQCDYIIIDTPPSTILADSAVAARSADGVLFVIKQDYASRDRVLYGMDNVAASGIPLIGCVLNSTTHSLSGYGYGGYYYGRYGYGYGRYGYGGYYGSKES